MSSSPVTSLALSQSTLVSASDRNLAARVSDSDSDDLTGDSNSDIDDRTADEGTIYNNKDLGFLYRRLRREMRAEAALADQAKDDDGQLTVFGEFADSAPSPVPETPAAYLLEEEDSDLPDVSASGKRSIDVVKSEEDDDTSHGVSDERDSKRRRVDSKEDDEEYQDWLFYQYARRQAAKREASRRRLRAPHAVMRTMQLPPRCPLPRNIHITTQQQREEDAEDSEDSSSDGDVDLADCHNTSTGTFSICGS
ncbi:hypothetical protein EXIGLDRAFT_803137 [Exidia glandulosa HHB12029]|uniref:Uncharacterized protein n=1 Tax=Exidia glandulosa HHB12029 TaxID=1314781 RepID=A0A165E0V1_EXIGL|nr:hypothetical protein EXIGLDRAFT_803137 [Exidia glandulosa HHB12029]